MAARQFVLDFVGSGANLRNYLETKGVVNGMYAVVESGGLQFSVSEGDQIKVPKIEVDAGATHDIEHVLLLAGEGEPMVGKPFIEGAKVETEVIGQGRGAKVLVFKFKRRIKYRRLKGHRQHFTELKVNKIVTPA